MEIDTDNVILIVVGAHLRAEVGDRPLGYRLRQRMIDWLDANTPKDPGDADRARQVVVLSDVWYLNNNELRSRPTVSIGAPGVNALSAFLADKLPSALAVEDVLLVQVDLDFEDIIACCWGVNTAATMSAVDGFCERYLDAFMRAATAE
jgi:hypothetical protein